MAASEVARAARVEMVAVGEAEVEGAVAGVVDCPGEHPAVAVECSVQVGWLGGVVVTRVGKVPVVVAAQLVAAAAMRVELRAVAVAPVASRSLYRPPMAGCPHHRSVYPLRAHGHMDSLWIGQSTSLQHLSQQIIRGDAGSRRGRTIKDTSLGCGYGFTP